MDGSGWGIAAVGLVLCFFGVRSVHVAVLASGFALGWLLAETFDAEPWTAAIIALAAAVGSWAVVTFVFRTALFFVGAITGGVVGIKLYGLLETGDKSVVLAIVFVLAVSFLAGLATQRFHRPVFAVLCALGGAGLVLSGVARLAPGAFGFLKTPGSGFQAVLAGLIWLAIAAAGWIAQRRHARAHAHAG
ncbi:MAG: DUF4203 domain-containing protein [Saccharothrix sp.]|nr:DUF4203 domain-containing protein [Saccharothrix sp.]